MECRVSSRRNFRPLLASLLGLALIGSAGVFSAAQAQTQPIAPDTMAARVQGCTACHGVHGEGTDNDYFPRLAGKPADYLYNQLQNFREGRRKYPPMNYLVTYLSDDYLHQIADVLLATASAVSAAGEEQRVAGHARARPANRAERRRSRSRFPLARPATARR